MTERSSPVAVTGLGIVSSLGVGHQQFWTALSAGASGVKPLPGRPTQAPHLAARVVDYTPRDLISSTHLRRMDGLSRAIVSAGRLALADARLDDGTVPPQRMGIVVGSALGNISESVQYLERLFTKGPALASPMMFPNLVLNAPASHAAMEIGCTGVNLTVSQGEISGEHAVALGCELIRAGRADVVLAGGGDELDQIVISAYRRFRALSSQRGGREWCSPYDVDRNGVVLGEGAGVLVLESPPHARRRGARVYAEIEDHVSFAVPSTPYDWPRRAPGAAEHLREFLAGSCPHAGPTAEPVRNGSVPAACVDLVCGSANSSRRLDACELDVLGRSFGELAATVALTSIKGAIGEFGAAGTLTAGAACLALHHGAIPPLCSLRTAPLDAAFQFVSGAAVPRRLRRVLIFSLARGGAAIALLLRGPSA